MTTWQFLRLVSTWIFFAIALICFSSFIYFGYSFYFPFDVNANQGTNLVALIFLTYAFQFYFISATLAFTLRSLIANKFIKQLFLNNLFVFFFVGAECQIGYFTGVFSKYADFSGRTPKKEFWMFTLIFISIITVLMLIALDVILIFLLLALLVPSISIAARRLHDTGRSGWWQLIALIPLIGIIVLIVFLVQDSDEENNYGIAPKGDASA